MNQSRRDLMKFGGLGFLGIATGVIKTPEGILLPHDKIVTIEQAKQETMVIASGYLTNFAVNTQIDSIAHASISMRTLEAPVIRGIDTDLNLEFKLHTHSFQIHERMYENPGPMKVVIYR